MLNRRQMLGAASASLPLIWQGCSTSKEEGNALQTKAPLNAAVLRAALNGLQLDGAPISVRLPLLDRIYDLNAEVAARFLARFDGGFGQLGLLLDDHLANGGYWCTPFNSLSFGRTGGDGHHFSFLITSGTIDETTPVVVTVPDNIGTAAESNVVFGRFEDFVRLGLHCGYFSMGEFVFDADVALKHYARTDWNDLDSWASSDNHRAVAEFLVQALQLKPLTYSRAEFDKLQSQFRTQMQFKGPPGL